MIGNTSLSISACYSVYVDSVSTLLLGLQINCVNATINAIKD